MKKVTKNSVAGTLESSDAYVTVETADTLTVEVQSAVAAQYGQSIKESVLEVVKQMDMGPCKIMVQDRGALDCVIRARVETALRRAL